ncbi:4-amino-4-deoxychorismate lyase [Thiohalospira halophila DSM 15071]|uniref:Aminodeoxychorismate lyase n=1 Tax=Thiohalospira halophila DSM 15071 TaxID=1123397 RepID=A0A1I1NUE5_9GAMM|nr:aminodeoxychorismate lyase [Thiohalospira halophila]SFD01167.1 4-amino-4-deoxychorismate lyase [Thiohalospira halophila DSM 15071]
MNCLLDGRPAEALPLDDRGVSYGDALFETLRVVGGRAEAWSDHMARLSRGATRLGLPAPDVEALAADAAALFADGGDGILRLWWSRGSGGRGYRPPEPATPRRMACRFPAAERPAAVATVRRCTTRLARQPLLAGLKHANRLEQVLARAEWDDPAIHEGLVCDTDGVLVEAVQSNLFWVREGVLETPDLSESGVAGIIRNRLLTLAEAGGLITRVVRQPPAALAGASEAFLTNSVFHLWPIARFEGLEWPAPGPVARELADQLSNDLEQRP